MLEHPTDANQQFGDSITFQFPLSSAPVGHYIEVGDPAPAGCLGNYTNPGAAPGNLCVFEDETFDAAFGATKICNWLNDACTGPSRFGFTVVPFSSSAGVMETDGTWAVTAPTSGSAAGASGNSAYSTRPVTEAH